MFKIIFIDESKDEIDSFLDYIDDLKITDQVKIESLYPLENIHELIAQIFESKADAIITDFMLNELKEDIDYTVPYNGVELVEEIRAKKNDFPCFVMTSFDKEAINLSPDVNIIYIKEILHGADKKTGTQTTFMERVIQQINHYKSRISDAQKEFYLIIKKSKKNSLTANDEARLLDLDSFLERALNQESQIPAQLKEKSTLNDLHKLIENTDVLLAKFDNDNE